MSMVVGSALGTFMAVIIVGLVIAAKLWWDHNDPH